MLFELVTVRLPSFTGVTADSSSQGFTLFTGLSPGPGTYYLILSSTDATGSLTPPSLVVDDLVSMETHYADIESNRTAVAVWSRGIR
jgi:hypothetical protein